MTITLVVALSDKGVIGRCGGLPWSLSRDLQRFKADTMGKPIIMGRKTQESIGRALPGRVNIVVTRNPDWRARGVVAVPSVEEAFARARRHASDEICVIGGGEIFSQALPFADRLRVTHVLGEVKGDTYFPECIDQARWTPVHTEEWPASERDSHATRYVVYERLNGSEHALPPNKPIETAHNRRPRHIGALKA